jgi:RNA polymerase sigma factor (sigma-70 family)
MVEPEDPEHRFTRVLDEYGRALRDAVARVCRGPLGLQRDEIEQEARIRLWRALRRETPIENPRLYLHRIVATAAIDAMRQIRSRRETPLEPARDETSDRASALEHKAPGPSPERVAQGRELAVVARRILSDLPTNRRRAVALHLQGFTSEEIGVLLGWSEGKARNLVYRGLGELRERLKSEIADTGQPVDVRPAPDEVAR